VGRTALTDGDPVTADGVSAAGATCTCPRAGRMALSRSSGVRAAALIVPDTGTLSTPPVLLVVRSEPPGPPRPTGAVAASTVSGWRLLADGGRGRGAASTGGRSEPSTVTGARALPTPPGNGVPLGPLIARAPPRTRPAVPSEASDRSAPVRSRT
jgi:hypothetical protein